MKHHSLQVYFSKFEKVKPIYVLFFSCTALVCTFCFLAKDMLFLNFSFLLGIGSLPFVVNLEHGSSKRAFSFLGIIPFLFLLSSGSNTLFYLTFAFCLYALLFYWNGRLNFLPLFMLLLVSPVAHILIDIIGFPIRLSMSSFIADVLSGIGFNIQAEGNLIKLHGEYFSVDEECVGLNMMITALVFTIINLAYEEKIKHRYFSFWSIIYWLTISFLFMLAANVCRILTLVLFVVPPESVMHDLIGLACLVVYNILPIHFLLKRNKFGLMKSFPEREKTKLHLFILVFIGTLGILLFASQIQKKNKAAEVYQELLIETDAYAIQVNEDQIFTMSNENVLVYIKPPVSPFRSAHNPTYCWRGSGYQMKSIKKMERRGQKYYQAVMEKGEDRIYTAWWWTDGIQDASEDFDWRIKSLGKGRDFYLINVNVDDPALLLDEIVKVKEQLQPAWRK